MVRQSHLKRAPVHLVVLALVSILLAACAGGGTTGQTTVPPKPTRQPQINYGLPPWWADNTGKRWNCDKYNYIHGVPGVDPTSIKILYTWRGLEVCGPLPELVPKSQPDNLVYFYHGASQEQEFECTELVKRYLYMAYGLAPLGRTNGSQVVDKYTATYPILHKVSNYGTVKITPAAGDVLSYGPTATNSAGHTSIVTGVNKDGSINVIQQNVAWTGKPVPTETLRVVGGIIQPSPHGAGSVISWMTTRDVPAVLGTSTQVVPTSTPTSSPTPTPAPTPVPAPTPMPVPPSSHALQILGPVNNLSGYCQSIGDSSASLDGSTAYNWTCVAPNGEHDSLSMTAACRWQYNDPQAEDRMGNYFDPNSWECFTNAQELGPANNLSGYCQSIGDSTASLDGSTAYDWSCVTPSGEHDPVSMTAACRWQYNDPQAEDRLSNYFDPQSWECWG